MNKIVIAAVVALVVLGGIYFYSSYSTPALQTISETETDGTATSTTSDMMMKVGPNALFVTDQKPGKEVKVQLAVLEAPGFVVIHEVKNGEAGKVLGASALLSQGDSKDLMITLSSEVKDGASLVAMLHADDGDGKFDATKDQAVKDAEGNIIMMEFGVSTTATVDVEVAI